MKTIRVELRIPLDKDLVFWSDMERREDFIVAEGEYRHAFRLVPINTDNWNGTLMIWHNENHHGNTTREV